MSAEAGKKNMRCYFMRGGHIASVEFLEQGLDTDLIKQSHAWFETRNTNQRFDGFEVWDGARRVYVFPEVPNPETAVTQ